MSASEVTEPKSASKSEEDCESKEQIVLVSELPIVPFQNFKGVLQVTVAYKKTLKVKTTPKVEPFELFLYDSSGVIRAVSFKKNLSELAEGTVIELSTFAIKEVWDGLYARNWKPVPNYSLGCEISIELNTTIKKIETYPIGSHLLHTSLAFLMDPVSASLEKS